MKVFISYSTKDGSEFATQLRAELEQQGIAVWQDIVALRGGDEWWAQIEAALDTVKFMVLVATPGAMASEIVAREWRTARQKGVCVCPVIVPGLPIDFATLPGWMQAIHFYHDEKPEHHANLLSDLAGECHASRIPFMASRLPHDFVPREQELNAIVGELLHPGKAITAALRGAGGYGKTTLARAVCHDERIQNTFYNGILWVELGETPKEAVSYLNELILMLTNDAAPFVTVDAARTRLKEILQHRAALLVIDDVWKREHLTPFLDLGDQVALLITTRNIDTLPAAAQKVTVDAMQPAEAARLLLAGITPPLDPLPLSREGGEIKLSHNEMQKVKALTTRLGEWALLLKLVNGMLHTRIHQASQTLAEALDYIEKVLEKRGLRGFDARNSDARSSAVDKTLGISLELLSSEERRLTLELAIFPEDVDIPFVTLEHLWGMDSLDTEDFGWMLYQRSLLLDCNLQKRTIRLHDVIREYFGEQVKDEIAAIHERFLDTYPLPVLTTAAWGGDQEAVRAWADLPTNELYLWDHLVDHLIGAKRYGELGATVDDLAYIATKIFLRGVAAAERDLEYSPSWSDGTAIAQIGHLLSRCETRQEVSTTLNFRVFNRHSPITAAVILPALAPRERLPDAPSSLLIRTLTGHTDRVNTCAIAPDQSWIASGGGDHTVKIWSTKKGIELLNLTGHTSWVNSCAISPDGQWIASAANDNTLKIWERATGNCRQTLNGHKDAVIDCAISPDGTWLVSASNDHTLIIWNASSGEIRHSLTGHTDWVSKCRISPDGSWILSASADGTLKIWDSHTGQEKFTLAGHTSWVTACAISPDGSKIYSFSADGTLIEWDSQRREALSSHFKLSKWVNNCVVNPQNTHLITAMAEGVLQFWQIETWQSPGTLHGHTAPLTDCIISADGKLLVSASRDHSLRLWSAHYNFQPFLSSEEKHLDTISVCISSDTIIMTGSQDKTIKLWQADHQLLATFSGHEGKVNTLAVSPNEQWLASGAADGTLFIWDIAIRAPRLMLKAHRQAITGCAISPNGKWIVSGSRDKKLKVWDSASGEVLLSLKGHSEAVTGCAISPNGKWIVSSSEDCTLRIWNSQTGHHSETLQGHTGGVTACAFSPDGKWIISTSADKTLKIWDSERGTERATLRSHKDAINACAISPDGQWILSAARDKTLRVWRLDSGAHMATFYADSDLFSCAWQPDSLHLIAGGEAGYLYWLRFVPQ